MGKKLRGMIEKEAARKIVSEAFQNLRTGKDTISGAYDTALRKIEEAQDLYSWQSSADLLPEDTDLARVDGVRPYIKVLAYVNGKHFVLRRIYYPTKDKWLWSNGFTSDEVEWWCALVRRPSKQTVSKDLKDDNGL